CSSTPEQSSQHPDFRGHLVFTVQDRGEMPKIVISAAVNMEPPLPNTDCRVRVVDEMGKPVAKVQARLNTASGGYQYWIDGGLGIVGLRDPDPFKGDEMLDVLLRADGYASAIVRFSSEQREQLRQGQPTVTLKRGQKVELQFRLPRGLTWPKGMLPEAYFKELEG